jgi:hypothetical protein
VQLNDPNPKARLDAALALAEAGDFSGLQTIVAALASDNHEVRLKAAYLCEQIGFSTAIEPLSRMALNDRQSENRKQAIFALAAIGRPAVVAPLISALDDTRVERRQDARLAQYMVLGRDVLRQLSDEDGGVERDPEEVARISEWWERESGRCDPALVYAMGEPASPGVFIRQLRAADSELPDLYLGALHDWTGEDFGEAPLQRVDARWAKWWAANEARYEPGRRYFHGHRVPD